VHIEYVVSRYPADSYGDLVRRRRLEMGLTQFELAKRLKVNEMTIVGWEKGWHYPRARLRLLQLNLGLE
jgi:transcriptional regulator with XRE-family HTH domain